MAIVAIQTQPAEIYRLMRWDSYLNTAQKLISEYSGDTSLPLHLKQYFRRNKRHGSTDRRIIADFVFSYYRLGKNWMENDQKLKLAIGFTLFSKEASKGSTWLKDRFGISFLTDSERMKMDLEQEFGTPPYDQAYNSFKSKTWREIEKALPVFPKPMHWLHIRPEKWSESISTMQTKKIYFTPHEDLHGVGFEDAKSLNLAIKILPPSDFLIQDWSTIALIAGMGNIKEIWDACAGSGGKILGIAYKSPKADLYASDIRNSILKNLVKRSTLLKMKNVFSQVYDATHLPQQLSFKNTGEDKIKTFDSFSHILIDAPCTGSGTWKREPEKAYFFDSSLIDKYSKIQEKIVRNVWPFLSIGGLMDYVTCSLFEAENEEKQKLFLEMPGAEIKKVTYHHHPEGRSNQLFQIRIQKVK